MAQEMQSEDQAHFDGQSSSSEDDEERTVSPFDGGFSESSGEKLREPRWRHIFIAQRLILGIVSLLTFAGILLVALPLGMNAFTFSLEADFVKLLAFLGPFFYLILALVTNVFFRRRNSLTVAIVSLLAFAGIVITAFVVEELTWSMNANFEHGLFIVGLLLSLTLAIAVNTLFRRKRTHLL